ncbi:TSL-kinase interacting protein 1 isoform X2 [Tasmannia lanceolata]|uniref:TSL-kinase interacting protein 1 isoform X2 n=1 Tax=Tasmannia lanceolata TaxID=3420 RepID=UPI004062E42C
MHTQLQVPLELESPPSENGLIKDGEPSGPLSPRVVASEKPVKKQTRQWAAWTRQEEENFFNALKQVGKNFDKITCRVQSKNKDQVRHYYYRLVRRMNKLLGPGFSLDAKNSKDTNAAMLRWWSLLEKYSCTASKLHLKPRRFKIFVEALEHQLLKDRKKTKRKRPSQGEIYPSSPSTTVSVIGKAPGSDSRSVKLVIVDGQNIQKVGPGKGSSLKRNVSTTVSCNKGDLSTVKTAKQRRRTGGVSSAAYKRWEKAAMAGVSLVADAAEQLETMSNKNDCPDQTTPRPKDITSDGDVARSLPSPTSQSGRSQPPMKLKLQLFPIDEATRRALEKDEHNPHLELTLTARKKISSVLEHLNRKWGNSSIASGELMLFPYSIQKESPESLLQWTLKDTIAIAADVYATVGSPAIFRLRYGWISNSDFGSGTLRLPPTSPHSDSFLQCKDIQEGYANMEISDGEVVNVDRSPSPALTQPSKQFIEYSKNQLSSMVEKAPPMNSFLDFPERMIRDIATDQDSTLPASLGHTNTSSWLREEIGDGITGKQWDDVDNIRMSNDTLLSAGEWADSLTNISMGDLLSEASRIADANCTDGPTEGSALHLQQIPFNCDSFDAAIAAHIAGTQDIPSLSSQIHPSSIWDAEETCDAFSFQKVTTNQEVPNPPEGASFGAFREITRVDSIGFHSLVEELNEIGPAKDAACERDPMANPQSDAQDRDDSAKNFELTDLYWPDSLGPLDLDFSSSRYQGQDLILGDSISLSGLNRLIATSLDAFQNCSFFCSDKKELSTNEVRGDAPLLDKKLGSEGQEG